MSSYDLDTSEYEMGQSYDYGTSNRHVDWESIYLDLDLLKFISELGTDLNRSETETIAEMVRDGADLEGVDYGIPVHAELDEMYDGVGHLTSQTPLTWAILANNESAVEFLLSMGANVDNPNEAGQTPLEVAISQESPEMVDLLIAAGSQLSEPMRVIRTLEERISTGDPNASQLSQIVNSLYEMIFTRVQQRGGYYRFWV